MQTINKIKNYGVILSFRKKEKNLDKSLVDSQKGITALQGCSVENQKGTIAVQSLWR